MSVRKETAPAEKNILALGGEILRRSRAEKPGLFNASYWHGRMMEWAMRDPSFKTDLFRLVDVLPALETEEQILSHVREYLLKEGRELPALVSAALKAATSGLGGELGAHAIRANVMDLARRFIAGSSPGEVIPVLRNLHEEGTAFTMDILGEATLSVEEALRYQRRYIELIDILAGEATEWRGDEAIDENRFGPMPRVNVSLKVTAMDPRLATVDPEGGVARLKEMVMPILLRAREKNVFVNFDLEQWSVHEITFRLFREVALDPGLKSWPHLGIVIQAYHRSAVRDFEYTLSLARERGAPVTVRLVKGAYWDYEVAHSRLTGLPCPVFTEKAETDVSYEKLSIMLLENSEYLYPAFASHNIRSISHAIVSAAAMGIPENGYEIQMLYGMAEPERKALGAMGKLVRLYVPAGEFLPGIGYLVRRLLENTSNSGFLRLSYHEGLEEAELLRKPEPPVKVPPIVKMKEGDIFPPFENCGQTDFSYPEEREKFKKAIESAYATFPLKVPVVISGDEKMKGKTADRHSPNDGKTLVAEVVQGDREDAELAVEASYRAWPSWRGRKLEERGMLLERLADILLEDRFYLASLQVHEVGKPWLEADADVAEAVDFCRYYARRAVVELASRKMDGLPGEDNLLFHEGRGPAVVIAPWNFPLAILCGMTVAAAVAGNTVIIKPSSLSSGTGYALHERMLKAGFPPDVVHFFPCSGGDVGDYLVSHPLVAQIAFTGSKDVGLSIVEKSARTRPGQPEVKRVVCEMGGKNAIIVDEDADLDEAVSGILTSAFGYAGQKCSACSRVIVLERIYRRFTERLAEACRSVAMEPAYSPACQLGPVVSREARERLMGILENPGKGAEPLFIGAAPEEGYFVPPALFAVPDMRHPLMQKELFGPIIAIISVPDFDSALKAAGAVEFALTGGVYSRRPANMAKAVSGFRVGNLYMNRSITGAIVGRQPFGGFAMSGIGTKAGGPGYLTHFADPRCVTENTIHRGFVPELEMPRGGRGSFS